MSNAARRTRLQRQMAESAETKPAVALVQDETDDTIRTDDEATTATITESDVGDLEDVIGDEQQPEPESSESVAVEAAPTKKERKMPTFDEALATAKEQNPHLYRNVLEVTQLTQRGEPKRVVIRCADPQFKMEGTEKVSVCAHTREIAVQDLFQVYRCVPCADRAVRKARRNKAKVKAKAMKALIAAAK